MPQTNIPSGSNLAVKAFSVALFTKMARAATFHRRMTGAAPKDSDAARQLKAQTTDSGMPIVEIRDLAKGAGDRATYDIIDILTGKPVMGDKRLSGKMMPLEFGTQEIKLDQMRAGVDPGGRMTRKRTKHDLRKLAMANLLGYNATLMDNITQVHLAGARGTQNARDWHLPLESDPDFADIMVNDIAPPTFNRRFVAGDDAFGDSMTSDIDNTMALSLTVLDALRTAVDESEYPLQGVKIPNYSTDDDEPLYVLRVSPIGYGQLRATSTDKDWNTLTSNAIQARSMSKHPIFGNGDLLWRNILIKQTRRSIRFDIGTSVAEYTDASTLGASANTVQFDRAILLGAQALAVAYGSDDRNGYHLNWHEEETDHGNRVETSTSIIKGCRKLTFTLDGVTTDHGVVALDHYSGPAA